MDKKQIIDNVIIPIEKQGFHAYFVGGCVRDALMNVEPHDYDICTDATPKQLHTIFEKFSNTSENAEPFGVTMPLIKIDNAQPAKEQLGEERIKTLLAKEENV